MRYTLLSPATLIMSDSKLLHIHILHYREPQWMLDRLLTSLSDIADIAHIDVISGGFDGHIGEARRVGFGLGLDYPYCSFVDPDDIVVDSRKSIETLLDVLENDKSLCGAYTDYEAINENGQVLYKTNKAPWSPISMLTKPFEVLHLKLYRTLAVSPYLHHLSSFPTYEEIAINGLACHYGRWRKVDIMAYQKTEPGSSMRLATEDMLRAAVAIGTKPIMSQRGLGDWISRATTAVGIMPCGGCKKRAEALNRIRVG